MTRRDPPGQAPDELRDEDIRALLDAQPPAVSPADLDARIRREAHAAASPTAPATAPAAPGRTLTTRLGPWVAVAAAVVLTVLLVPLLPTLVTDPLDPMADGRYRSEADLETSASDDQVVNKKTGTQATAPTSGLIIDMAADKRESIAERAPSIQQESAALAVDNASRQQVPAAKMSASSDSADQTAVQS
ncbi:MAG: hypothetical protein KTR32_36735, partial [Granulosicoccus sp.]|nr:hypothetical protein [Granulosicoccus sp.]